MELKDFIKKYEGGLVDYDGYYGFQCTDLVRQYCLEMFGETYKPYGNAGTLFNQDWGDDYIKYENTPDFIPSPGDIVIFNGPTVYGHIGIVVSATLYDMEILDQNTGTGNGDGEGDNKIRIHTYKYTNVIGFIRHKSLIKKNKPMKWGELKTYTENGKDYQYYDSIYGLKVEVISEDKFDRQGLLKLHGATTYKPSYILLSTWTIKKGLHKVCEVMTHEFSHLIYHTILKENIYEKINDEDFKLTKYEYWDYLSNNCKSYISEYASTHTAEDFAENVAASYYIDNGIELDNKFTLNKDTKFKYIIANNLFKYGLEEYLKQAIT